MENVLVIKLKVVLTYFVGFYEDIEIIRLKTLNNWGWDITISANEKTELSCGTLVRVSQ